MPDYRLIRPIINKHRTLVWYVAWTENRRSRRQTTGLTDKVAAEAWMIQFAAIKQAPPAKFTVEDLCAAYLAEREENPSVKYPKAIANSLAHIRRAMGPLTPDLVSRATVRSYVAQRRLTGVVDATISKELRFLRQALKFGVREKWMRPEDEPAIDLPGEGEARERFLTRSEFARLYFHASPFHLRVFLALAISTAARGKHILSLTWDRVDFEAGMVRFRPGESRNKRTVPVPMNDRLRSVLERAYECRGKSGFVVEWKGGRVLSVRKAYERACRLAGLDDAHRHDLRRTAASWAVQDGNPIEVVAQLLGDSVETTRKHYAVFAPDYLRGVVHSIGGGR